jgi:tape measure domain-containing protein
MSTNLGNIGFGITPNTTGLSVAQQQVTSFGAAMMGAARNAALFGQNTQNAMRQAQQSATALAAAQAAHRRQLGGGAAGAGGQQVQQVNALTESLRTLSSVATLVAGPLSGVATRISVLSTLAGRFTVIVAGMTGGIAAALYSFLKLSTGIIEVERNLQKAEATLTAVHGSATLAQTDMKYLGDLADRAGVNIFTLSQQYGQLTAAAKGTNLEGERTRNIFEAIVFAGAKLGLSVQDTEGALRAVQQIISKGTVQAEELRSQLGDRIPGAVNIMAEALGVTTVKLEEMTRKGEVGSSALVKFAEVLKSRFNIDTSQRIGTITAAEERLSAARARALDTIDKTIGFSQAYINVLGKIASALNNLDGGTIRTFMASLAGLAGLLLGLSAPAIMGGLAALMRMFVALTAAVINFNVAVGTNPYLALAGVFIRLSFAIGGAVAGFSLMNKILGESKESTLRALPPVEEYIKAQEGVKSSVRATTEEYIKQQQVLATLNYGKYAEASAKLAGLQEQLDTFLGSAKQKRDITIFQVLQGEISKALAEMTTLEAESTRLQGVLTKLQEILAKQTEAENTARSDPKKDQTNRQSLAIKNANDTINELNATYANIFRSPFQKAWNTTQIEINKQIENFRDVLTRAELPAETIVALTNKYGEALRKVKEGEFTIANSVSAFSAVADVFSRGVDRAMDAWIETVIEGKDQLLALRDVAKAVAQDILKTFITLAALNPLKNALFGLNTPVMGGTAGTGGWVGDLISAFSFAKGGVMGPGGPVPLRSYAKGGVASGPQMALFGEGSHKEAYVPLPDGRSIPVTMNGGGGAPEIHVHEAPGVKAAVSSSRGKDGRMRIDVHMQKLVGDMVQRDLSQGGPLATMFEQMYGLNRARGAVG